ncbi:hypothetical protein [Nocardia xishanensis]
MHAAAKSCDLGFVFSRPTVIAPGIRGDVWAECDAPPTRHSMTVTLERRDTYGGWQRVGEPTSDERIPRPRVTYEVHAFCDPGVWRITASVTGSLQSTPFSFIDHSKSAIVNAKDCTLGG